MTGPIQEGGLLRLRNLRSARRRRSGRRGRCCGLLLLLLGATAQLVEHAAAPLVGRDDRGRRAGVGGEDREKRGWEGEGGGGRRRGGGGGGGGVGGGGGPGVDKTPPVEPMPRPPPSDFCSMITPIIARTSIRWTTMMTVCMEVPSVRDKTTGGRRS